MRMTGPNLFVVGAMKAGTTTLHSWLQSHPDIYMAPVKEPNYFSTDLWDCSSHIQRGTEELVARSFTSPQHNALIRDHALYARLFAPAAAAAYRGEASPSYLRSLAAPQRIRQASPAARIIMLLRDPVERAWSHYLMERNEAHVPETFEATLDDEERRQRRGERLQHGILESGLYGAALDRYRACFPDENILVLDTGELRDPAAVFDRLARFLAVDRCFDAARDETNLSLSPRFPGLNRLFAQAGVKRVIRGFMPRTALETFKRSYYVKAPRADQIAPTTRARLRDYYRSDVQRLQRLLGSRTPGWAAAYQPAEETRAMTDNAPAT